MPAITAKSLREQRAKIIKDARAILDKAGAENRDPTAEERTAWAKLMGDNVRKADGNDERIEGEAEKLATRIAVLERQETAEADLDMPANRKDIGREDLDERRKPPVGGDGATVTDEHRALAIQGWCRSQMDLDLTEAHEEACRLTRIRPHSRSLSLSLLSNAGINELRNGYHAASRGRFGRFEGNIGEAERRALSIGSFTAGGALVPTSMAMALERAMLQFGGILQVASMMRTSTGEPYAWPVSNDTSNTGALLGENPSSATELDVTVGARMFYAYEFTSKMVRVSNQLLQDSAIDLVTELGNILGERLGRVQNTYMTTGTGGSQPEGIVTGATLGVTAASATAIAFDELFGLVHSVDPAYRTPGCGWMMHDNILLAIRRLKDGNGRYLWQDSTQVGEPDRLLNFPITANQDMQSSIATATKTILFGQLNKYKVRQVQQVIFKRLVERYAELNQEGFVMFVRSDGKLVDAGTHPVKYLLQA